MSAELLQQIRYVLIYPLMATTGLFWATVFLLRWRRGRCVGDFWAGVLGLAVAGWALAGVLALWLANRSGFSAATSLAFTLGLVGPAMALLMGTAVMLVRGWRR